MTLIAAAVLSASALALAPAAQAEGTSAVVVNQRDSSDVYRLMLQIRRAIGDTLDTSNTAVAVSSCNACQTVAVSLQAVLDMSYPSVFVPENLAIAMNVDCNLCQTLAVADQTILETGGPVHFTPEGSQAVAEIRQQLEAIRSSNLSIYQIQSEVDQLNWQLQQVLLTQVVAAGPPPSSDTGTGTDTTTTSTPTDTSTTPTDTSTTPTDTSTTPTDTGTSTSPSDTGTTTTSTGTQTTDSGTSTSPSSSSSTW